MLYFFFCCWRHLKAFENSLPLFCFDAFALLTCQPDTLNLCWIWVSCLKTPKLNHFLRGVLIQWNHRPMSPIQSKRKSRTVDHPKNANNWFLCNILGFVASEKRQLLFAFLAMTQHHSTIIFKMIYALCFDLVFPFLFSQIDASTVCTWRRENNKSIQIEVQKPTICSENCTAGLSVRNTHTKK